MPNPIHMARIYPAPQRAPDPSYETRLSVWRKWSSDQSQQE